MEEPDISPSPFISHDLNKNLEQKGGFNDIFVDDDDDITDEEDDDEREIESILQKHEFKLDQNKAYSQSAHANLSLMGTKSRQGGDDDIESSDEEFYVHKALLPLRKSRTMGSGFAPSHKLSVVVKPHPLEPLTEMQVSSLFEPGVAVMDCSTASTCKKLSIAKKVTLPDDAQDLVDNGPVEIAFPDQSVILSPTSSAASSNSNLAQAIPGCWSAPAGISDESRSESESSSESESDEIENETWVRRQKPVRPKLRNSYYFNTSIEEERSDEDENTEKVFRIIDENDIDSGEANPERCGTSWSSPSRLRCKKRRNKSSKVQITLSTDPEDHTSYLEPAQGSPLFGASGEKEKKALEETGSYLRSNLRKESWSRKDDTENEPEDITIVNEVEDNGTGDVDVGDEIECMSTSSEESASSSESSRSQSPAGNHERTLTKAQSIGNEPLQQQQPVRVFLAPQYSGISYPANMLRPAGFLPSSKSDSQLVWYHGPINGNAESSQLHVRRRIPNFDESLNRFETNRLPLVKEYDDGEPRRLPHSFTYDCHVPASSRMTKKDFDLQGNQGQDRAGTSHETHLTSQENLIINSEESAIESEQVFGTESEQLPEFDPEISNLPNSNSNETHSPMKKKKSSFALADDIAAQIPMADDPNDPSSCTIEYNLTSVSNFVRPGTKLSESEDELSQYDNYNTEESENDERSPSERECRRAREKQRKFVRRGSPPMACMDDLLSDSEISELERRVARGDFPENGRREAGAQVSRSSGAASRESDSDSLKNGGQSSQPQNLKNICGSTSMPSFASTAIQTERQPLWHSYAGNSNSPVVRRNVNIQKRYTFVDGQIVAQSLGETVTNSPLLIPKSQQAQRRILPLRPDEREQLQDLHQACLIRPEHSRPTSQNRSTGRRLPEIPCEERLTGERIAAFYTHSETLNNPIHSTVPFRTAAEPPPPIRLPTFPVLNHMTANDCESYEVERQVVLPETSHRHPAVNHSPPLSTLTKPNIAQFLPQPINATLAYCPKTQVDKGYQFSYGMDASLMKSSSVSSQKHINSFGIMEDSYYEDGLNGNNSAAMDMLVGRAVNQLDNRRHSGYNLAEDNSSGVSSCCTSASTNADQPGVSGLLGPVIRKRKISKDSNGPTHRAQFPFFPRHSDEILLEVGDAVRVDRECEDHWCYGTNLRSGQQGIFPSAHVCEIDLVDEICQRTLGPNVQNLPIPLKPERDTFYLTLLASMEVCHHKGNDVLVQAINKVCSMYQQKDEILVPQTVLMEVSFRGIHVIDKRKKDFFRCPAFDYFYSLQNISFCGAHPKQLRYFGFITKHPLLPRFACHVFLSQESTQPIVEAIGRAFKRSYDEYMAFAHPTEDIFIE